MELASLPIDHLFFFFFFQGDQNTKQKKNCSKTASRMRSRAIQCKQAAYTSILIKVGNGRHVNVCAWPRPSRSAWAENIATAWLPIQTYGKISKGHNFNSKA